MNELISGDIIFMSQFVFLDEDLANYLTIMRQISASIDRILEKSRCVVGSIDFEEG